MDRPIAYTQEQGRSTDFLFAQRSTMIAIAKLSQAVFGSNTVVRGLAVTPNSPAALNVLVGIGEIYTLASVDATTYGSLPADTTDQIVQQGLNMAAQTISTPAPSTSGYSINYLIEAQFQSQDTNPVVLPFYNSANPQQPLNGQGGNGATLPTERQGVCVIQAKAGIAATTGTQVTPSVDSGWTALAVVTVANGQVSVGSGNISIPAGVPQITSLLQMMQADATNYAGLAGGTANAITATLSPAPTSYTDYLLVTVRIAATNTGSVSLNVNGLGVVPVIGQGHQTLQGGELFAGGFATFAYSTNYSEAILLECTGGALQIAPATQSQHAVQLQQIGHGQCRLSVTNTTTLTLNPFNGNNIIIGGVPRQVPNGGVTVSNAGTNPNTLYYVYVSWGGGGNIVLSLSTTGHSTSSTGIETMTGNTNYTLVGMVYMNGSAQFIDTATTRTCLNWFNRRNLNVNFISLTSYNFTSTTFAEVTSALRLGLITWGDECVTGGIDGEMSNNTASQSVSVYSAIDGAQVGPACGVFESSANGGQAYSSHSAQFLSEGYHTPSIYGEVSSGTGTLQTAGIGYIIRG